MKKLTLLFSLFLFMISFSFSVHGQEVKSSNHISTFGIYEYTLEVSVPKKYKAPFAAMDLIPNADGTDWEKIPIYDTDGNGKYEVTFRAYNGVVTMYWSDFNKPDQNKPMRSSPFFYENLGCVRFALVDGQMIAADQFNPTLPGIKGDNYIRWGGYNENWEVPVFVNNSEIRIPEGEEVQYYFALSSPKNWEHQQQEFFDASGWGRVFIDPDEGDYEVSGFIGLGYGALLKSGKIVWPSLKVDEVKHWNTKKDGFMIPIPD